MDVFSPELIVGLVVGAFIPGPQAKIVAKALMIVWEAVKKRRQQGK